MIRMSILVSLERCNVDADIHYAMFLVATVSQLKNRYIFIRILCCWNIKTKEEMFYSETKSEILSWKEKSHQTLLILFVMP